MKKFEDLSTEDILKIIPIWVDLGETLAQIVKTKQKDQPHRLLKKAIEQLHVLAESDKTLCKSSLSVAIPLEAHVKKIEFSLRNIHSLKINITNPTNARDVLIRELSDCKKFIESIGGVFDSEAEEALLADNLVYEVEKGFKNFVIRSLIPSLPKEHRTFCRGYLSSKATEVTTITPDFTAIKLLEAIGIGENEIEEFINRYSPETI